MRVICITGKDFSPDMCWAKSSDNEPAIGDILTVVEEKTFMGIDCYRFAEWVTVFGNVFFDCRNFSPLDGPCEKEMMDDRADQEIAHLDKSFRDLVHEVENA